MGQWLISLAAFPCSIPGTNKAPHNSICSSRSKGSDICVYYVHVLDRRHAGKTPIHQ